MSTTFVKNAFAFIILVVIVTLIIDEYKDLRQELTHIRTEFRKQEFEISNLKALIKQFAEIGVELRVIDLSDIRDVIHVSVDQLKLKANDLSRYEKTYLSPIVTKSEKNIVLEDDIE